MAYSLKIKQSTTWYDVSDWVVSCSDVPIIARNVNYEPDLRGFKCAINANYNSGSITTNARLSGATYVKFGIDGTEKFLGKIQKNTRNYRQKTYDYDILNALINLDDYYIDEATLDASIIGGAADGAGAAFTVDAGADTIVDNGHGLNDADAIVFTGTGTNDEIDKNTVYYVDVQDVNEFELHLDHGLGGAVNLIDTTTTNMTYHTFNHNFNPYDNETLPNLTTRHAIESVFDASGLDDLADAEVSTGAITTEAIADDKWVFQAGESWDAAVQADFDLSEIRLDKNMLYAINQDYAINTTKINSNNISDYDTEEKKVSFLSFLRQIFPLFYLVIYYEDGYVVERHTTEGTYSVGNDDLWDYDKEEIEARLPDSKWQFKCHDNGPATTRLSYADVTEDALSDAYITTGKATAFSWYNNLIFLVEGGWAGAATTDITLTTGQEFDTDKYNYFTPEDGETAGKDIGEILVDEATAGYTKETITTAVDGTFQNVALNEIDPKNEQMTIIEITW